VRIRAASQALGVPVPTLRRWTQEFAAGLSPEARASEGRPREFTARDMRVLRRAKEVLGRDDVTYERARRELTGEGLMAYEAEESAGSNGSAPRDAAAEREAAERFVSSVVERAVAPFRDQQAALVARVGELERELRALREQAASRAYVPAVTPDTGGVQSVAGMSEADRRRGWRFR
jgi:DNA-binding transcriptional MerR regulator